MPETLLERVRELLRTHGLWAIVIPSSDPHGSEYLPEHWKLREAVSGFTGSAGDLLVTREQAGLWTDSRYFIQAQAQLEGSGIDLFRVGLPETPSLWDCAAQWCPHGSRMGFFGALHSHAEIERQRARLAEAGVELLPVSEPLIGGIWLERPALPSAPAFEHPLRFAGERVEEKLARLRGAMQAEHASVHVITQLDAVAWLFNIRGADIAYNPLLMAYALVTPTAALLYAHPGKIGPELETKLQDAGVMVRPYDAFFGDLEQLAASGKVWIDASAASWAVVSRLNAARLLDRPSPITAFKAVKNAAELEGMRNCHIRDGVAMVRFLRWMEEHVPAGGVTEISAARQLEAFRRENEGFVGLSFETISAYGPHGAIVHYAPDEASDIPVGRDSLYLVDSGAQYVDGTTDITRTLCFGEPTPRQKEHFTRVLAGHLQLAITVFPRGTAGKQLDTIARMKLWEAGLQYGHGTGHGIGAFLGVHEGPHAISFYRCRGDALVPGMLTTNEPGLYVPDQYGIRIENVLLVLENLRFSTPELPFYEFEPLTLCPIALNLVEPALLTPEQQNALDRYHEHVQKILLPLLAPADAAWLVQATRPLPR